MTENLSHAEVLGRYCGTFVDELVAAGVENVCLCPGSRSTPLALTFARHPGIKLWMHLDERSCAYFALGMAKASGKPVAILCSSGTAAVNFAPAVVEAFHSHVPLIVLTADRPPELQGLGANQTIDQQNLYGPAAKWFVNLPLPEASDQMLRYVRMVADRAIATALEGARGPVHLNFSFREPLVPAFESVPGSGREPERLTKAETSAAPPFGQLDWLAAAMTASQRGLVICGPLDDADAALSVQVLSEMWNVPLLADPVSKTRSGGDPCIIGLYDNYLRIAAVAASLKPDLILRFGAPPTSKPLNSYLQRHSDVQQVVVSQGMTWQDPDLTADVVVDADIRSFCSALLETVQWPTSPSRDWYDRWESLEAASSRALVYAFEDTLLATEPSVFYDLRDCLPHATAPDRPNPSTVFAGNSMPVRDMDSFFPPSTKNVRCFANRGASGIDGVVSTALGAAAMSEGPTVLVIGDLSFYHDMNGLL
ncbi:MAG TPA: 2-succinyl-5-enolpyruvyl-6-hydroxy-3-cyclohexene-1-carboxylic-acid synthase, partial [Dehalococcoidia bacterium]|nr:2-succinyl-5-enolpyruvyl-6-hydroxy-3-cyclohexene-1-carboxylic-acid synthase [Dehalococcoidia bacterium]